MIETSIHKSIGSNQSVIYQAWILVSVVFVIILYFESTRLCCVVEDFMVELRVDPFQYQVGLVL